MFSNFLFTVHKSDCSWRKVHLSNVTLSTWKYNQHQQHYVKEITMVVKFDIVMWFCLHLSTSHTLNFSSMKRDAFVLLKIQNWCLSRISNAVILHTFHICKQSPLAVFNLLDIFWLLCGSTGWRTFSHMRHSFSSFERNTLWGWIFIVDAEILILTINVWLRIILKDDLSAELLLLTF
jgi:hypothetical protein